VPKSRLFAGSREKKKEQKGRHHAQETLRPKLVIAGMAGVRLRGENAE